MISIIALTKYKKENCIIYASQAIKTGKNVNKVFRRIVRIYFNVKEGDDVKIEEEQDENLPVKNHCCNCC